MMRMIERGVQIDEPYVFIPWLIAEDKFKHIISPAPLKFVTSGYYTLPVLLFGEINCIAGFHFDPPFHFEPYEGYIGRLHKLELFRGATYYSLQSNQDSHSCTLDMSYYDFQNRFEEIFGQPSPSIEGFCGYKYHTWLINRITVSHYVFERFGPEEHVNIDFR